MLNHLCIYNTTRLPVLFVLCSLSLSLSFSFFRGSVFHKAPDTRQGERVFNRTAERMHGQKVGADKPPNYSSSSSPFLSVLLFFLFPCLFSHSTSAGDLHWAARKNGMFHQSRGWFRMFGQIVLWPYGEGMLALLLFVCVILPCVGTVSGGGGRG